MRYRINLLGVLFFERILPNAKLKHWFSDFIVESRSILGYVYERSGNIKHVDGGIQISWREENTPLGVFLRWNSSDFLVFEQVLIKKEYGPIASLVRDHRISVTSILDAGANIGCSSIYLSTLFPKAKLLAVEPEPRNHRSLLQNFNLNKLSAHTPCVAIWNKPGFVSFAGQFRDGREWAVKVEENQGEVPAVTLSELLQSFPDNAVDILKMDIEGAETEVFDAPEIGSIIQKVKVLAIEIHSDAAHQRINSLLNELGFIIQERSETLFAVNVKLLNGRS